MKIRLFDQEFSEEVHTVVLTEAPYSGDVEFDLRPKTRALVQKAQQLAKKNPIYNRHSVLEDGKRVVRDGRPDDAFVQELAKLLVVGGRGVVDKAGNDVDLADDRIKVVLFEDIDLSNLIIEKATGLGVIESEAVEGES